MKIFDRVHSNVFIRVYSLNYQLCLCITNEVNSDEEIHNQCSVFGISCACASTEIGL